VPESGALQRIPEYLSGPGIGLLREKADEVDELWRTLGDQILQLTLDDRYY
jgi:hypothetical protein